MKKSNVKKPFFGFLNQIRNKQKSFLRKPGSFRIRTLLKEAAVLKIILTLIK